MLSVLILRLSYDEDGWIEEIIQYIYSLDFNTLLYWSMAIIAAHLYGLWKIIKRWKRAGFYWIVAACIALIGYGFIYAPSEVVSAIVTLAIYLGLTYVVLRFRNSYNAKSTWEQLD